MSGSYVPPAGNAVSFDFTDAYEPPTNSTVSLDLATGSSGDGGGTTPPPTPAVQQFCVFVVT